MHVIQSQLNNYTYDSFVQKHVRLVRWWIFYYDNFNKIDHALPFTKEQEEIFVKFMDDHPVNFPKEKREIFNSANLVPPSLTAEDQETDSEKPCIVLIRTFPDAPSTGICRRMDIALQNHELPIKLPFDIAGEIILETK